MFVAECYVDIPSVSRAMGATEELAGLADLMKAFAPAQMDKETEEAMRGLSQFSAMTGGDFVATGDLRDGEATLAFKLTPAGLRVPIGELEGDSIVVGRIQRKWPEGQRFPLLNVPGLNLMSREDRRRMEREKPADDQEGMYVNGPACLGKRRGHFSLSSALRPVWQVSRLGATTSRARWSWTVGESRCRSRGSGRLPAQGVTE